MPPVILLKIFNTLICMHTLNLLGYSWKKKNALKTRIIYQIWSYSVRWFYVIISNKSFQWQQEVRRSVCGITDVSIHPFFVRCPKKLCDLFWPDLTVLHNDVCHMLLIISLHVHLLFDVLDILCCQWKRICLYSYKTGHWAKLNRLSTLHILFPSLVSVP